MIVLEGLNVGVVVAGALSARVHQHRKKLVDKLSFFKILINQVSLIDLAFEFIDSSVHHLEFSDPLL